jgi:hypothetical protein
VLEHGRQRVQQRRAELIIGPGAEPGDLREVRAQPLTDRAMASEATSGSSLRADA